MYVIYRRLFYLALLGALLASDAILGHILEDLGLFWVRLHVGLSLCVVSASALVDVLHKYVHHLVRNWVKATFFVLYATKLSVLGIWALFGLAGYILKGWGYAGPSVQAFWWVAIPFAFGAAFLQLYGIAIVACNFSIRHVTVTLPNLPEAFEGLRIGQISDIHCGSIMRPKALEKALKQWMQQGLDVICFTGDLVNVYAEEVIPYTDILKQIQAPMGVYAVMGNHDYGLPGSAEASQQAREQMQGVFTSLGWTPLMNTHVRLSKGEASIALLGVENWSSHLFGRYGKLQEAYAGLEKSTDIQILLSHDPSHWDMEVLPNYPSIDLTLSGHTHGAQLGVETKALRWSPAQYVYPRWAGLYCEAGRHLYVSRGVGCVGFLGRIGIRPELTVIELKRKP